MTFPYRRHVKRCLLSLRVRVAGLYKSPPDVPFLILGEARTGTNLLADLLRSHPEVGVAGEILNPYNPEGIRLSFRSRSAVLRHIRRTLRALDGVCRGAQTHIYHFRLHRVPIEVLCQKLPELRFVVIHRRSLAEQFVSWKLAKQTGRWVGNSDAAIHKERCVVDPQEFRSWCANVRDRFAEVTACDSLWKRAISIAYEDLATSAPEIMRQRVFPFLGVESMSVQTRLRKQNPRSLPECVENYAEVADLLNQERLKNVAPS